jgi:transcriptional regulator GlxA family with amidase domain
MTQVIIQTMCDWRSMGIHGGTGAGVEEMKMAFMNAVPLKVSVCTGALLLGAAGFLHGKRATTNSSAYELLEPYCQEVVKARIVKDGNTITGGGVATRW